jgi:Prophage endopeptidase tail
LFINIDYNKRKQEAKLHLAKPNKQIISHISEKFKDALSLKLGNINELNFSIPHFIEGERNEHVDLIKEKMLIKVTLGAYQEWYVIDEIGEDGDDTDIFNVKAFSLGYELRGKRVRELKEESANAEGILTSVMKNRTIWKVGEIDPIFNEMFRSFDITNSNVLDAIIQAGETFGALIVWDTVNRKVSFKDMKQNGRFRGMTVNYGKFLRSIRRTRTTDEMVTRLHIEGSEGLTIHGVNPTGQGYIEDFSYFMYPFERDASGKVIKSSHFMSDELCIAIEEHKAKMEMYSPEINAIFNSKVEKEMLLFEKESALTQLNLELESILALLDTAQGTGDETLIQQRKDERDTKEYEILVAQSEVDEIKGQIDALQAQLELRQVDISYDANFTPQLLDELDLFIIEKEWLDDRYTDAKELYDDGLKKFEELRQPKVVIDVTIDNLLNIIEEQYYWDKLVLGDLIKVKYPQMNIEYMAKIIEINYDLENGEASLVIANTTDLLNETDKLVQLLYSSSSASSLIQNNKYKWDKINAVEKEVNAIITQEWDANKNKIIAGVNNSIEVGNRGILITNPDFPQEVVIMQSGIIALSMDGGETWKTAIKPDGIVAERLIGKIIAGQELIITNSGGSFTFDKNGVYIRAESFIIESGSGEGKVNLRDVWNGTTDFINAVIDDNIITAYEKKMLKSEWEKLLDSYNSSIVKLNGYFDDQGNSIPEIVSYHQSYENLHKYLFEDLQTDDYALLGNGNMSKSTRVDRVVFEERYNTFYEKRTKVDEILSLRAKELAQTAQETADEAKKNIEEVMDDVVYSTRLFSTNGDKFTNGRIDTIIYVEVYRGKENITDTLPASAFVWRKTNEDGTLDTAWANAHVGIGKSIHIDKDDVNRKATFWCDIDIPE